MPSGLVFSPVLVIAAVALVPMILELLHAKALAKCLIFVAAPIAFNHALFASLISNPLALPTVDLFGFDLLEYWHHLFDSDQRLAHYSSLQYYPLEWFRYPLLLIQQIGMVMIGAYFAIRAIERRRRSFE